MSLILVKNTQPNVETLTERVYHKVYAGTTAEVLSGAAAMGVTLTGDSGSAARVVMESHFIEQDPEHPGHARLVQTYRTGDVEEWLMLHPGKAVLHGGGGIGRKAYSHYDLTLNPVQGWRGNIWWEHTDGEPVHLRSHHVQVVHGYVTDANFATLKGYGAYCGKKHTGTAFTNLNNTLLIDLTYKPVSFRDDRLYVFDASFASTDSYQDSCSSTPYAVTVTGVTAIINGTTTIRPVETRAVAGVADSNSNILTADLSYFDNMLTGSW